MRLNEKGINRLLAEGVRLRVPLETVRGLQNFEFQPDDFDNCPKASRCTNWPFLMLVCEAVGWLEARGNEKLAERIKEAFCKGES